MRQNRTSSSSQAEARAARRSPTAARGGKTAATRSLRPAYFDTAADFRAWLQKHHDSASELLVGFRKVKSGEPSMTWPESVDQALCFGWIDGVRRSIDAEHYCIRFTPRKAGSVWSRINIERFRKLEARSLAAPAGRKAFSAGKERTDHYSYENAPRELSPQEMKRFRSNAPAWADFERRPPSYRKAVLWWVVSAKQAATRERRLARLIEDSAAGRKVGVMEVGRKKG